MGVHNDPYGPHSQHRQQADTDRQIASDNATWQHQQRTRTLFDSGEQTPPTRTFSGRPDYTLLIGIASGGLLCYWAAQLHLNFARSDRLWFLLIVFIIGLLHVGKGQMVIGMIGAHAIAWGIARSSPDWRDWPWQTWAMVWGGSSLAISTLMFLFPKFYRAVSVTLMLAFLAAVVILGAISMGWIRVDAPVGR